MTDGSPMKGVFERTRSAAGGEVGSITGELFRCCHRVALGSGQPHPSQPPAPGVLLFPFLREWPPHLGLQLPHESCLPLLGLLGALQLPPEINIPNTTFSARRPWEQLGDLQARRSVCVFWNSADNLFSGTHSKQTKRPLRSLAAENPGRPWGAEWGQ